MTFYHCKAWLTSMSESPCAPQQILLIFICFRAPPNLLGSSIFDDGTIMNPATKTFTAGFGDFPVYDMKSSSLSTTSRTSMESTSTRLLAAMLLEVCGKKRRGQMNGSMRGWKLGTRTMKIWVRSLLEE